MAVGIRDAPQVRACDAALKLGCSLSPELSHLLSTSRGTCQLNATPRGAEARSTKARVVSYIPGDDGTAHHRERAKKTTRSSAPTEPEQLPVQLDFDPEEVFEYASNPLTGRTGHVVERGALWLDGKSTSRVDDVWRGFGVGYKATPLVHGPGGGSHDHGFSNHSTVHPHGTATATGGGGHGNADVLVRVVDCPMPGMPDMSKAAEGLAADVAQRERQLAVPPLTTGISTGTDAALATARNSQGTPSSPRGGSQAAACRRPPARRPASAGAATAPPRRAQALTPARPTTPCSSPKAKRPVPITVPAKGAEVNSSALLCASGLATPRTPRQRCQDAELERCLQLGDSMMQVSSRRWDVADIIEKRQLVRGAVPRAGEVSSLIQQVRRQRALSRRSPRHATHTGT